MPSGRLCLAVARRVGGFRFTCGCVPIVGRITVRRITVRRITVRRITVRRIIARQVVVYQTTRRKTAASELAIPDGAARGVSACRLVLRLGVFLIRAFLLSRSQRPVAPLARTGDVHCFAILGDRAPGDRQTVLGQFADQFVVAVGLCLSSWSTISCSFSRTVSQATSSPSALVVPPTKNRLSGKMPRGV